MFLIFCSSDIDVFDCHISMYLLLFQNIVFRYPCTRYYFQILDASHIAFGTFFSDIDIILSHIGLDIDYLILFSYINVFDIVSYQYCFNMCRIVCFH